MIMNLDPFLLDPLPLFCRGGDQDIETEDLLLDAMPGLNLSEGDAIFSEVSHQ